jgi:gamma-tubulin complex component 2
MPTITMLSFLLTMKSEPDPHGLVTFHQFDARLYTTIEDAYTHANRTLLELLVNEQQLVLRLRALRRYFFMANAASITHWLDLAHTELKKPARHASVSRLQSLLELALAGDDGAFRDDIRVTLNTTTLYDWLHKILRLSGAIDEGADADAALLDENADAKKEKEKEKDKDAKNKFLGTSLPRTLIPNLIAGSY